MKVVIEDDGPHFLPEEEKKLNDDVIWELAHNTEVRVISTANIPYVPLRKQMLKAHCMSCFVWKTAHSWSLHQKNTLAAWASNSATVSQMDEF